MVKHPSRCWCLSVLLGGSSDASLFRSCPCVVMIPDTPILWHNKKLRCPLSFTLTHISNSTYFIIKTVYNNFIITGTNILVPIIYPHIMDFITRNLTSSAKLKNYLNSLWSFRFLCLILTSLTIYARLCKIYHLDVTILFLMLDYFDFSIGFVYVVTRIDSPKDTISDVKSKPTTIVDQSPPLIDKKEITTKVSLWAKPNKLTLIWDSRKCNTLANLTTICQLSAKYITSLLNAFTVPLKIILDNYIVACHHPILCNMELGISSTFLSIFLQIFLQVNTKQIGFGITSHQPIGMASHQPIGITSQVGTTGTTSIRNSPTGMLSQQTMLDCVKTLGDDCESGFRLTMSMPNSQDIEENAQNFYLPYIIQKETNNHPLLNIIHMYYNIPTCNSSNLMANWWCICLIRYCCVHSSHYLCDILNFVSIFHIFTSSSPTMIYMTQVCCKCNLIYRMCLFRWYNRGAPPTEATAYYIPNAIVMDYAMMTKTAHPMASKVSSSSCNFFVIRGAHNLNCICYLVVWTTWVRMLLDFTKLYLDVYTSNPLCMMLLCLDALKRIVSMLNSLETHIGKQSYHIPNLPITGMRTNSHTTTRYTPTGYLILIVKENSSETHKGSKNQEQLQYEERPKGLPSQGGNKVINHNPSPKGLPSQSTKKSTNSQQFVYWITPKPLLIIFCCPLRPPNVFMSPELLCQISMLNSQETINYNPQNLCTLPNMKIKRGYSYVINNNEIKHHSYIILYSHTKTLRLLSWGPVFHHTNITQKTKPYQEGAKITRLL